jgi:pimeloyl-ACP methyl ester carboxylesterase
MQRFAVSGLVLLASAATGCGLLPRSSEHEAVHTVDFDGTEVFYRDAGAGPTTLVFIHGWACDHTVWSEQVAGLREHARLLLVDLPGQGRSAKPMDFSYTMDVLAGAVAAVMDDAKVERAVLVGHSNGGLVARQFYRRFPARTAALVIVDEALILPQPYLDQIKAFGEQFRGADFPERMEAMVEQFAAHMDTVDQQKIRIMVMETPRHVALATLDAALEAEVWKPDPIGVPMLCVMAESPLSRGDYEEQLRRIAPRVVYHVLQGTGHFVMMDAPEQFDSILLQFLADQGLD